MEENGSTSPNDSMFEMRMVPTTSDSSTTGDGDMVFETESASATNKWTTFFDGPVYGRCIRQSNYIRSRLTQHFDGNFSPDITGSLVVRRPVFEIAEHPENSPEWKKRRCLYIIILVIAIIIMIVVGSILLIKTFSRGQASSREDIPPFTSQVILSPAYTDKSQRSMIGDHKTKEFVACSEPSISTRSSNPVVTTLDPFETEKDVRSTGRSNVPVMSTLVLSESEDSRIFSSTPPPLKRSLTKITSPITIRKTSLTCVDTTSNGDVSFVISDTIMPSATATSNIDAPFSDVLSYTISPEAATASNLIDTDSNSIILTVTSSKFSDTYFVVSPYTLDNKEPTASITTMQRTSLKGIDTVLFHDITTSSIILDPLSDISRYTLNSEESTLVFSLFDSSSFSDGVSQNTASSSVRSSPYEPSVADVLSRDFETVTSSSYLEVMKNRP